MQLQRPLFWASCLLMPGLAQRYQDRDVYAVIWEGFSSEDPARYRSAQLGSDLWSRETHRRSMASTAQASNLTTAKSDWRIIHGAVYIAASDTQPPLLTDVVEVDYHKAERIGVFAATATEYNIPQGQEDPSATRPGHGKKRTDVYMGTTTLSNIELFDYTNYAQGVLRDVWTDPNGIKGVYETNVSDCMGWVNALIKPDATGNTPLGRKIRNYSSFLPHWEQYIHRDVGWAIGWEKTNLTGLQYIYHTQGKPMWDDAWKLFRLDPDNLSKLSGPTSTSPGKNMPLDKGYESSRNTTSRRVGSTVQEVTKP